MMREAASRGHELWACEPQQVVWQRGSLVQAQARRITLTGDAQDWYDEQEQALIALSSMDAVLMRKDPPFDAEYLYATHLLTQAEREGLPRLQQAAGPARTPGKARPSSSSRCTSRPPW